MNNKVKIKLTVVQAICNKCGYKRKIYFMPESSYGERIVSTKSGEKCAYVNLLEEDETSEINKICKDILNDRNINISATKLGKLVSKIYVITCDMIKGEIIDDTPSYKCSNCNDGEMEEDDLFGEKVMEIEMPLVTHNRWNGLDYDHKVHMVLMELKKYISLDADKKK